MLTLENKFLLEMYGLSKRIKEIENGNTAEDKDELTKTIKERELIEKKYKEFEKCKIKYAEEYIKNIKPESEVKTKATQMMQNVFIKDLVEASKDKGYITMTPLMRKTLFSLRDLNVRKIVPYTRRVFESEDLPIAADDLVETFSNVLLETGIAYSILPEEVKSKTKPLCEKKWKETKEKINNDKKCTYERKICHYYKKQDPNRIKYMYENVMDSMRDITKHDIAIATGEEKYDGELKEIYEFKKIKPIKRIIGEKGKTSETMTSRDKEMLLEELLKEKQKGIEKAVASKMAIEYIGGMTDNTILAVLLDKNLISREDIIEGYGREEPAKSIVDPGVKRLQKIFEKNEDMIYPDDKEDNEICL